MYGHFCIGFIDFMHASKTLTDFTSMFSPYDFEKTDSIILSSFKDERKIKFSCWLKVNPIAMKF